MRYFRHTIFSIKSIYILFFGVLPGIADVKAQSYSFEKSIGATGFEKASAVKLLADGNIIITGETESFGLQERDMLLMKTDSNGQVIWTNSYGGPERETVNDVLPLSSGNLLFAAEKYQPNKAEGENLTLIETDKNGNLIWKKIFDEGGHETEGFQIAPTPDNQILIAGMLKKSSMVSDAFFAMRSEEQCAYLLKVDRKGNKQFSRCITYGENDVSTTAAALTVCADASILLSGNVTRKGKTDKKIEQPARQVNTDDQRNLLLAKISPNGNLLWAREISGAKIMMGYTVLEKKDGSIMLAGNTTAGAGSIDIVLMHLDKNGNVIWAKTYGGTKFESVADMVAAPGGGWIVTGITYSTANGISDVLTFKTDDNGALLWAKTYGGANEEYPSRMAIRGNSIFTAGSTGSNGTRSFDVLLYKTALDGSGTCFSRDATLSVKALGAKSLVPDNAKSEKIEQGVYPPNMKKPEVQNISNTGREMTGIGLCK
ncbi:MAG: hypothetical protein IPH78_13905 [Bacteroidetes bacterium]|nr:hypothetical protein [Bacteroidota bacterium]